MAIRIIVYLGKARFKVHRAFTICHKSRHFWYILYMNGWEYINVYVSLSIHRGRCLETAQGQNYSGYTSVTESGLTCQRWGRQYPHEHPHSDLHTEENFCRNPDNTGDRPWCFTIDDNIDWEYCDIPVCSEYKQVQDVS